MFPLTIRKLLPGASVSVPASNPAAHWRLVAATAPAKVAVPAFNVVGPGPVNTLPASKVWLAVKSQAAPAATFTVPRFVPPLAMATVPLNTSSTP